MKEKTEIPIKTPEKIELPDLKRISIKTEKIEVPEKKETRGRKPKPKPITWDEAKKSDIGKGLDELIKNLLNRTVLKGCEPLSTEEVKVGSAMIYTVSYYLPDVPANHPIMILAVSFAGLGFSVLSKKARKV